MVSPEQLARAKSVSLLSLLDKDKVLKKAGSGYMLACEWHEDSDPSMSLFKGSDGNWRYFCHGCGAKGDTVRYLQVKKGMTFVDAVNYLTAEAKSAPAKPIVAATYDYCSAEGELLYQVLRYQPKDFRVRRPTQNGWAWNLKDIKRVLYRLPELLEATKEPGKTIYVVEGEKDCDNLRKLGHVATTFAGGAGAYRAELLQQLPLKQRLVVVPDMDEPGKQLMRRVFADGRAMGHDVHFILIPERDGKQAKDVSEWLELGFDIADLLKEEK